MSGPKWLPDISGVEETIVGLFAINEGDEAMFAEAFALVRAEERAKVRVLVAAQEGSCHDGEGLGCEMSGDYPSRGGYGSCNITIDRDSVLAAIDALSAAEVPA